MKYIVAFALVFSFACSMAYADDIKLLASTKSITFYKGDRLVTEAAMGANQFKPAKTVGSSSKSFTNRATGQLFATNVNKLKLLATAPKQFIYQPIGELADRPIEPAKPVGASDRINLGRAPLMGVNVAGCEFMDNGALCPKVSDINWYIDQGFTAIRLPFKGKQVKRPDTVAKMVAAANTATSRGVYVILDRHDYGATFAPDQVPFWAELLPKFANPDLIMIDTMNEPSKGSSYAADETGRSYATDVNDAIAAFRALGLRHKILIEWKGASGMSRFDRNEGKNDRCISAACSFDRAGGLKDPLGLTMISGHRYFDADGSGTSPYCKDAENPESFIRSADLAAKERGLKIWIGEIAFGSHQKINSKCKAYAQAVINRINSLPEVYAGVSWWGGGSAWNEDYIFKIEPKKGTRTTAPRSELLKIITGKN